MNRLLAGSVLLLAACSSPSEPETPTLTAGVAATSEEGYQIDLWWNDDINDDPALATFRREIFDAAERWEELLAPSDPWDVPSGNIFCYFDDDSYAWIPSNVIDDLAIIVIVGEIDGEGGTLARASPCVVRYRGFLPPWQSPPMDFMPVLGMMEFDNADLPRLSARQLEDVIVHEMGHVLGFGAYGWETMDLLQNPAQEWSAVYQDTYFSGWRAALAFDLVGGSEYLGFKVPVENTGGEARRNQHWRQSVMQTEIMTPSINLNSASSPPVSILTLASLEDIGYTVDYSAADNYQLPENAPGLDVGEMIPFGDDILSIPITVVDRRGEVVGRLPGPVR